MANSKISDYTANTAPASGDLVEHVDISDTSMAATGTNKKATAANLITKAHGLSDGIVKVATGTMTNATSGTDYAPATSGSSILKGNGSGGFSNASSGTDYAPATSGTSILKGNGSGGFSNASAGTDYVAPDAQITDIAAITPAKGKVLYTDASNILALATGTDGHVLTLDSAQAAGIKWAAAGGGSSAPVDGQYLTLATNGTLTDERTIAFDDNLFATDGGAGSTYTISQKTARRKFYLFTDMIAGATNTDYISYGVYGSGAANNVYDHDDTTAAGVIQSTTGTTTTGYTRMYFAAAKAFRFATTNKYVYEARVKLDQLSDGTNTFQLITGFNQSSTSEGTDGVFFSYTSALNSGKFEIVTKSNGSATRTDTGTTVSSATWYNLRLEVLNVSGTLTARGYVNGSQVGGDITSNIPNGAGRGLGFTHLLVKSAGTTACTMQTDYLEVIGYFDSNR